MGIKKFGQITLGFWLFALIGCAERIDYSPVHVHRLEGPVAVSILAGYPEPLWFSPHPVLVVIDDGERQIVLQERMHNDGANLTDANFPVSLQGDVLVICFSGQEQADVKYVFTLHSDEEPRTVSGGCSGETVVAEDPGKRWMIS